MANVQKTVDIIFGGRNEVGKVIDSIGRDFDKIGGQITGLTGPLSDATNKILLFDAAIAALAAGAIVIAVQKAGAFGDSFKEISTLISASSGSIDQFRGDILSYAQSSDRSLTDINQSVYKAISAGISYRDVLGTLKTAEELAQAGRNDLASTTILLAGTMNAYGAKTSEAGHYADVFMQTVKSGLLTLPELAASLSAVTGIAAMGKVPVETLAAALAAVTSTGVGTEQAVTGIKTAISNIIKPTDEAEKLAAKLGIQFNASALATRGFEAVLWDAWRATKGNSEEMATLFGSIRGLNVATILAADSQGKFAATLVETRNAGGALAEASAKMIGQYSDINQNIKNNIDVTLISIGARFLETYGEIGKGLSAVFQGIKVGIDAGSFDPLFNFITQVGKDLAAQLQTIAKNLPAALEGLDFSRLIASLGNLGQAIADAFGIIFGEIDLDTAEGLHDFIQRLINAFGTLVDVTHGIVDGMRPLWEILGWLVGGFEGLDTKTAEMIGRFLGVANSIQILAEHMGLLTAAISVLAGGQLLSLLANMGRLGGIALGAIPGMTAFMTSMGAFGAIGVGAGIGLTTGALLNQIPVVGALSQGILGLIDINGNFFGTQTRTKEEMAKVNREFDLAVSKHKVLAGETENTGAATGKYSSQVGGLDESLKKMGFSTVSATAHLFDMANKLKAMPDKKEIGIVVTADGTKIETTKNMIYKTFPDGQVLITNIGTKAREDMLAATAKKIEEKVPASKVMEIQMQMDIARIKEQSEIIQKSIEWKAKVDIAQIEASAKIIVATFASIDNTITSTGNTISSMMGTYEQALGRGGTSFIENQIIAEGRRRDEALLLQKEMTEAQVALIKQQTESLKAGNAMIQIDGKGLQPHLEAFMFEILAAIQVKANAEGMKFLVGV